MENKTTHHHSTGMLRKHSLFALKGFLALFICAFALTSCDRFEEDIDELVEEVENREVMMFKAYLNPLNNSGVTGTATIKYSKEGKFEVLIHAKNLVSNRPHPQHIHGFAPDSDMANKDAVCPPMSAAGDDGLLTLPEGLPFYGPILVPFDDHLVPLTVDAFPFANRAGTLSYHSMTGTKELVAAFNAMYEGTQTEADLKLMNRVVVLHGAYVKDGKVSRFYSDGAEYIVTLPVACGEIVKE